MQRECIDPDKNITEVQIKTEVQDFETPLIEVEIEGHEIKEEVDIKIEPLEEEPSNRTDAWNRYKLNDNATDVMYGPEDTTARSATQRQSSTTRGSKRRNKEQSKDDPLLEQGDQEVEGKATANIHNEHGKQWVFTDFLAEIYGEYYEELLGRDDDYNIHEDFEDEAHNDDKNEYPYRKSSSPGLPSDGDRLRPRSPLPPLPDPELLLTSGLKWRIHREDGTSADSMKPDKMEIDYDLMILNAHAPKTSLERFESDRNYSSSCARCNKEQPNRGPRGSNWQPGQTLKEILATDDDVPLELRQMARDVIRKRRARVEASVALSRSTLKRNRKNDGEDSWSEDENQFQDLTDRSGNRLLEDEDLVFDWFPMETYIGDQEIFRTGRTGSVLSFKNPYDAFRSYWDDATLKTIVNKTNHHARIFSTAFQSDWYPTNSDELLCLFAFWTMTGIIRMPTIYSYFSKNPLLKTEVFSRITTLKRYAKLNMALNFDDTGSDYPTNRGVRSFDRIHSLRSIINNLNSKFQSNYVLSKDICINKTLTSSKNKHAELFGVKTFELCESATGYLWSFLIEENHHFSSLSKSTAVVLNLIDPLLNKGHRLFIDSSFNSPLLARYLKRNGTDCVGTLRASRPNVPEYVTQTPLKQNHLIGMHSGDVCVFSWRDTKRIHFLSTCHGSATGISTEASQLLFTPLPLLEYDRSMRGIHNYNDEMFEPYLLEPYLLERKRCAKLYIKLFKRLLNWSTHNARVLLDSSLRARHDNLKFRLELVHAILTQHHPFIPLNRRTALSSLTTAPFPRVLHTHWPARLEQYARDVARNRQSRQRCVVCLQEGRKMKRTPYKCEDCNVPLCVENCFKKYHSAT